MPNDVTAWNSRGIARFMVNDYEGALADFDYAVRLDSKFADAFANRAAVFERLGQIEHAVQTLRKALELEDDANTQSDLQRLESHLAGASVEAKYNTIVTRRGYVTRGSIIVLGLARVRNVAASP